MFYTNNWTFYHIPKTSGTNLRICTREQRVDFVSILDDNIPYWHLLMHRPLHWWIENKLTDRSIPIITFVRNPYTRAVSFWLYATKFKNVKMSLYDFYADEQNLFYGVREYGWDHSLPQNKFIEGYDVEVIKIESDVYKYQLEDRLGVKFLQTKHLKSDYTKPYQEYYDSRTQELILKMFNSDFETFGYSKEL